MTTLDQIRAVLSRHLPDLHAKGITEIGVFGSYQRGDEGPDSDVDILVDIARPAKIDLLDLITIENALSDELNTKVDLVLKSALRPSLGENILREVVYV